MEGINFAKKRSELMKMGQYSFYVGSIDKLKEIEDESIDGIILSNIIDNMYPEDELTLWNRQTEDWLRWTA